MLRDPLLCFGRARYKGVNTDLVAVPQFKIHESDTGSSEVQVRATANVVSRI